MSDTVYSKAQVDAIAAVIGNRISNETDAATIKAAIDALADTGFITDAERTKLAGLEASKFKGTYSSLGAIPLTSNTEGMYAHIDTGTSNNVTIAYWDNDDNIWVEGGSATSETAASIKTKYESNADTNNFSDAEKTKLGNLAIAANINDFTAALDGAIS